MNDFNLNISNHNDVNLADYDAVLINSSAGKDSQAMLTHLVEMADAQGYSRERLVVVHADLGRVEWEGTKELAQRQAESYGLRFEIVERTQDDLLEYVERRGKWMGSNARFCTSEFKRAPVAKLITKLNREMKLGRAGRFLNAMGIRSQESASRSQKNPMSIDVKKTGKGNSKIVVEWYPIFDWSVEKVWATIERSGVEHHRAYDLGMPRLSCVFCIYASRPALMLAGRENPQLLDEYVALENKIGHTFQDGLAIADIKRDLDAGVEVNIDDIKTWESPA